MQRRRGAKEKLTGRGLASLVRPGWLVAMPNLFNRDLGGAGHPPLVILHGLLGSSRNWQTVGRDLADAYHVMALDARNHGESPHAPAMDHDTLVADLLAWHMANVAEPVTLLGHSMGGKTAMLFACRHPERVARLIVVDIAPKAYRPAQHRAEFAAMNELDLATLKSRGEAEQRMAATVADWAMRKFLATNLARTEEGGWRWQINLPVLTAALPDLAGNALRPGDQFNGPTLFIVGGKSNYVGQDDHGCIRRHFPAAKIAVLTEAGHNPHMDARVEFVRTVRNGPGAH